MPGPPKKPTKLRLLEGNAGKLKINRREPEPSGVPRAPEWLDPYAKAEWRRLGAELVRLGLLTRADRAAMAAYCQCWAGYAEATAALRADGMTHFTPNGMAVPSIWASRQMQCLKAMLPLLRELGLTPAARVRLEQPEPEVADEFEEFERAHSKRK